MCGDECLQTLIQKAREKNKRRRETRERPNSGGAGSDVRRRVRARDNERCRWCGVGENLQVHHILYRSEQGPNTMGNLITLCMECHARAHSNKRLYQPVLRGLIWVYYAQGRMMSVPQFMRWYPELLEEESRVA